MQKFFIKSAIFLLLIAVVVFYFAFNFKRKYDLKTDYLATLIDKEARLNSLDSNRMIIVGGSNLAFGINSKLIEEKLPVKVANLGLHAGLSLTFMLNQAAHLMKKGDVIVLIPEYPLYLDDFNPDIDLIQFMQEIDPNTKVYYHFTPKETLEGVYEKFKKYFTPDDFRVDPVFNRQRFNIYGDNLGHLNKTPPPTLIDRKPIKPIELSHSLRLLKDFAEKCKKSKVSVLISYPPYPKSEYVGKNKERIEALDVKLRNNLPEIEFLDKPKAYIFNDPLFYDTVYHLNKNGREIRTKKLIEDLRTHIYHNSTLLH
ncbi:hypothetical protein [Pedobacter arcticus]|uniref:hypothetical protein n=1 Tax=Pedobacter arcticus TaxID=752140 RepID=UPI00030FBE7B|nr:hypothetical protein [Pedobacter arcticus]